MKDHFDARQGDTARLQTSGIWTFHGLDCLPERLRISTTLMDVEDIGDGWDGREYLETNGGEYEEVAYSVGVFRTRSGISREGYIRVIHCHHYYSSFI